jgi:hypothetical protein
VVRRSARLLTAAVLTAVVAVTLGACGGPDDETDRPRPTVSTPAVGALVDLPFGRAEVGPGNTVRVRGSRLVVDGRAIDLAPMRVDEVAVVRGGVFFLNGTELWFTDLDRARATAYTDVQSLVASPDGRRIAFLDLEHGVKGRSSTPLALVLAYDATTGKPLTASYAAPGTIRFDGDALVVRGATGRDHRVPVGGGG